MSLKYRLNEVKQQNSCADVQLDADEVELKVRRKEQNRGKYIYWQNCQSSGVNLSLEGCHLVYKESLEENKTGR